MKLRKIITMGLAAIMAVSVMSINVFAMSDICDENGNIIGHEYTAEDINWEKLAQRPALYTTYAMTASQPTYSSALNLASRDIEQSFSLSARNFKYSKAWYNSGDEVGVFLNDFSTNAKSFNFKIYKIASDGTLTQVKNLTPSISDAVAVSFGDLTSNNRYCLKITNNATFSTTGYPVITNDISQFFN